MAPGRSQKVLKALKKSKGSSSGASSSDTLVPGGNERPTEEEWKRMTVFKSFVIPDADDQEHRFERKDIVLILPEGVDPSGRHKLETYWVGRINDIRARVFPDKTNSVWVQLQWYYSGKDASNAVKSFDGKHVPSFERIFSDHLDFVWPEAFEAIIPMYKLSQTDPYQLFIPPKSFYRRYTLEYKSRKIDPKPGSDTCFDTCTKGYWPDKKEIEEMMRFCPRPSCRRSWHHGCLVANGCVEQDGEGEEPEVKGKKRGRPKGTTKQTIKAPIFNSTAKSASAGDDEKLGGTIRVRSVSSRLARRSGGAGPSKPPSKLPTRRTRSQKEREDEDDELEAMELLLPSQLTHSNLSEADLDMLPLPGMSQANGSQQERMVLSPRALRLLKSSPGSSEDVDLEKLMGVAKSRVVDDGDDEDEAPPKKRPRGRPPKKKAQPKSKAQLTTLSSASGSGARAPSLATILTTLPLSLLKIATQPLVRGGAFEKGGVAGNVGFVSRAREKVYDALRSGGGAESVEDWEDEVFGDDRAESGVGVKNAIVWIKDEGKEKELGEKRTRGGKLKGRGNVGKESENLPAFKCPNCGGAI